MAKIFNITMDTVWNFEHGDGILLDIELIKYCAQNNILINILSWECEANGTSEVEYTGEENKIRELLLKFYCDESDINFYMDSCGLFLL